MLRLAAWFKVLVSTPYGVAKSLSSITCCPLITFIRDYIIYDNQLVTICDQFAVFCLFRYVCHIYIHFSKPQIVTLNILLL